jgi:peptidoglycan/LPS O-acetylase OafA/YrhL
MGASVGATLSPTTTKPPPREAPLPLQPVGAAKPPSTQFLDGLRGLAAFYVLMRHVTWVPCPQDAGAIWRRIMAGMLHVFLYGHMAVIFFFVLSGFVIHLRYARRLREQAAAATFGWRDFIYRRARRIYPPFIAAILLTLVVDRLGSLFGFDAFYSPAIARPEFAFIPQAIRENHELPTLLGNLAFLMQMYVPVWGTDNPLWSLAFEWWFYMLYPLLWLLSRRSVWRATTVVAVLMAVSIFVTWRFFPLPANPAEGRWPRIQAGPFPFQGWFVLSLPLRVLAALPTWWCGVLLADVYTGRIPISFKKCGWFALGLIFCFLPMPEVLKSLAAGVGFCGAISLGFALQQRGIKLRILDRLKFLGDFSYTLYVTHWPLVIFLTPLWEWRIHRRVIMPATLEFLMLVFVPLIVAYVLHLAVERPFTRGHKPKLLVTPAPATA